MLKDDQIKTLMLSCDLEKSIADLYVCFAELYPELKDLWVPLIQEEQEHAEAIRRLYRLTYDGQCLFDEKALKLDAIQSIIDYVRETIASATKSPFSAGRALTIAYDLEKSLIEKDIFSQFRVAPAYDAALQLLQSGTLRHIQLAKDALDNHKSRAEASPR